MISEGKQGIILGSKITEQAETSLLLLNSSQTKWLSLNLQQAKEMFNSILDKTTRLIEEHEINPFHLLHHHGSGYLLQEFDH